MTAISTISQNINAVQWRESVTYMKTLKACSQKVLLPDPVNPEILKPQPIPVVANQGGTSSGKTYGLNKALMMKFGLKAKKKRRIDIVRKTEAELRDSVYDDFLQILDYYGLYNKRFHNKSRGSLSYELGNGLFRFKGTDSPAKKRGARREILYINEANGLALEDWVQLDMRTGEQTFIDYNPSEEFWFHDLYLNDDEVIEGKDYAFVHSTYKDNVDIRTGRSFLSPRTVERIEKLIKIDPYYYQVYVLGNLAELKGRVYESHETISYDEFKRLPEYGKCYGVDWGANDPTAIIECRILDGKPFYHEMFYKPVSEVNHFMNNLEKVGLQRGYPVYADPSRKDWSDMLELRGYPVMKTNKNIFDGIMRVRYHGLRFTNCSANLIKERKSYKWQEDKNGRTLDKPVDFLNHALDCIRQICENHDALKYRYSVN